MIQMMCRANTYFTAPFDRLDQTAVCDNGLDKFRKRCHVEFLAGGDIANNAVVQIASTVSPSLIASTASGHSTIARPMLIEFR